MTFTYCKHLSATYQRYRKVKPIDSFITSLKITGDFILSLMFILVDNINPIEKTFLIYKKKKFNLFGSLSLSILRFWTETRIVLYVQHVHKCLTPSGMRKRCQIEI